MWFEILNYPYYHELKCSQNTPDLMNFLEYMNCPCYQEGIFFAKIRQFCSCGLKIWSSPIIKCWNSHENLPCPYYRELKFCQKEGSFVEVIWKFELPLLSRAEIFTKTRQFCWTDSKIWTAYIMTGFNFLKNKGAF